MYFFCLLVVYPLYNKVKKEMRVTNIKKKNFVLYLTRAAHAIPID